MTDAELAALTARMQSLILRLPLEDILAHFDDMDAANEPEPDPQPRVMPAQALRRQRAPGGLWEPDAPG